MKINIQCQEEVSHVGRYITSRNFLKYITSFFSELPPESSPEQDYGFLSAPCLLDIYIDGGLR